MTPLIAATGVHLGEFLPPLIACAVYSLAYGV